MQFWSIILAAASFAFKIEVKRTHSAVEKRSKVISLPAVFPDLTLRKGDKVLFSAETEEAFEQLILALSDNDHGSSYSYHLKKAVSLVLNFSIGPIIAAEWSL